MSSRRDIMVPRKKKDGGTYWVKIGTAWKNDNGQEQLVFDALPIPDSEGRCVANLFEPRENDNPRGRSAAADRDNARSRSDGSQGHATGFTGDDLDDRIPFISNRSIF